MFKIMALVFRKNVLLAPHTTFRIGGPAKYFCVAKSTQDLIKAIKFARLKKLPYFILGGGSNVLVSDEGFKGLVIQVRNKSLKVENDFVFADAGVPLSEIVLRSRIEGLNGIGWAAGIPGTIGGAVFGNAGTPKGDIGQTVYKAKLLTNEGRLKSVSSKWFKFSYRYSRLKDYCFSERPIILSVELKLRKGSKAAITREIKKILQERKAKIPLCFSAGCVFKNPANASAGLLIDKCGLKGKRIGGVLISEKHANFIINIGSASAQDILVLIRIAKKEVWKKFKIKLEEEIQLVGFK